MGHIEKGEISVQKCAECCTVERKKTGPDLDGQCGWETSQIL
jgi:cytochrome c2